MKPENANPKHGPKGRFCKRMQVYYYLKLFNRILVAEYFKAGKLKLV